MLGAVILVAFSDALILNASRGRVYSEVSSTPYNRVGLVLGTSPYMRNGTTNPFFEHRMDAALALYRAGKISVILVSGDNERRTYNEPARMKEALLERGIPERSLIVDSAGLRTLDSVVRAGSVFRLGRFTIISQGFHNRRALFVARAAGLDAIAFNARDVGGYAGLRQAVREHLARTLAVLDVYLLGTIPSQEKRNAP